MPVPDGRLGVEGKNVITQVVVGDGLWSKPEPRFAIMVVSVGCPNGPPYPSPSWHFNFLSF